MNFRNYFKKEKFSIIRDIVISVLISALISGVFTYYFNKKIDIRISERQFIYDFGRTFLDNPKYRDISIALEEQSLYGKKFVKKNGEEFNDYEIDDYLYLIDDMWNFYKEGFISKELLEEQYSYFFCITYNSLEIKKYRERLVIKGFSDTDNFLDDLAAEFNLAGKNCKQL